MVWHYRFSCTVYNGYTSGKVTATDQEIREGPGTVKAFKLIGTGLAWRGGRYRSQRHDCFRASTKRGSGPWWNNLRA